MKKPTTRDKSARASLIAHLAIVWPAKVSRDDRDALCRWLNHVVAQITRNDFAADARTDASLQVLPFGWRRSQPPRKSVLGKKINQGPKKAPASPVREALQDRRVPASKRKRP